MADPSATMVEIADAAGAFAGVMHGYLRRLTDDPPEDMRPLYFADALGASDPLYAKIESPLPDGWPPEAGLTARQIRHHARAIMAALGFRRKRGLPAPVELRPGVNEEALRGLLGDLEREAARLFELAPTRQDPTATQRGPQTDELGPEGNRVGKPGATPEL
jgi:hypothetical protein